MASNPDWLAKDIYPHLASAGFYNRVLAEAGWFEFVNSHRPDTVSPVTMACHAFTFLFVEGGLAHMRLTGVQAILAYLHDKKGMIPPPSALIQLRGLLDCKPVDNALIHEWFHRSYP